MDLTGKNKKSYKNRFDTIFSMFYCGKKTWIENMIISLVFLSIVTTAYWYAWSRSEETIKFREEYIKSEKSVKYLVLGKLQGECELVFLCRDIEIGLKREIKVTRETFMTYEKGDYVWFPTSKYERLTDKEKREVSDPELEISQWIMAVCPALFGIFWLLLLADDRKIIIMKWGDDLKGLNLSKTTKDWCKEHLENIPNIPIYLMLAQYLSGIAYLGYVYG